MTNRPVHNPPRQFELKILSDPATLAPTRRAVEDFARAAGFDEKSAGEVGLCVNEALANVICHAYGGATDRPIELRAEVTPDGVLRLSIRDWGTGTVPAIPTAAPREGARPGGLGLVCMHALMDEVRFEPAADVGMNLRMSRRVARPAAETTATAAT